MKSFKDEYKELLLWYKEKTDECDKIPSEGGYDGGGTEQRRIYTAEYRNRLNLLKEKYGKTTTTQSGYTERPSSRYASGK